MKPINFSRQISLHNYCMEALSCAFVLPRPFFPPPQTQSCVLLHEHFLLPLTSTEGSEAVATFHLSLAREIPPRMGGG